MYVEYHTKCQVYKMSELNMFITVVCVLFLKHEGFYWKHKETGRLAQLAHLSRAGKAWGAFQNISHAFLYCLSSPNFHSEFGGY